jgi:hypothetical protein
VQKDAPMELPTKLTKRETKSTPWSGFLGKRKQTHDRKAGKQDYGITIMIWILQETKAKV